MYEDSFLDSFMEDRMGGGYDFYGFDPDWNGTDWDDPYDRERDEEDFARGFDEAHARSEEEGYEPSYKVWWE